jgi:hypothetical protein
MSPKALSVSDSPRPMTTARRTGLPTRPAPRVRTCFCPGRALVAPITIPLFTTTFAPYMPIGQAKWSCAHPDSDAIEDRECERRPLSDARVRRPRAVEAWQLDPISIRIISSCITFADSAFNRSWKICRSGRGENRAHARRRSRDRAPLQLVGHAYLAVRRLLNKARNPR